ncbi:MAG: hypothetical protein PHT54_01095 [Candidatus Nanoarchaeia archaeon]|nr:hypothetical protein [Candidatus Nanoarchaeia archaeon]
MTNEIDGRVRDKYGIVKTIDLSKLLNEYFKVVIEENLTLGEDIKQKLNEFKKNKEYLDDTVARIVMMDGQVHLIVERGKEDIFTRRYAVPKIVDPSSEYEIDVIYGFNFKIKDL